MQSSHQEFTFINVTASRKYNTRTVKRHVSNQTNRRKRQEAVKQYQDALLDVAEPSAWKDDQLWSSFLSHRNAGKSTFLDSIVTKSSASLDLRASLAKSEDLQDFDLRKPLATEQPEQTADYWESYQQWALENLPMIYSRLSGAHIRRPFKICTISRGSSTPHIVVSVLNSHIALQIPRIDDPSEYSRMQWALKTCDIFIRGNYEKTWRDEWQDTQWYQISLLPLGIWRECFPLAVELIHAGKLQEAFHILNGALSVTPTFFQQNNPGLLIAIIGAMMYACQIEDRKLSTLIRDHVTQLSIVHLGPTHPMALLLKEQLRYEEVAVGRTDLLSVAIIDTFSDVFGPTHYLPLSLRFGYVRRLLSSGQYDAALASTAILEKHWTTETMPGSQLPKLLDFEKAKVLQAQQRFQQLETSGSYVINEDMDVLAAKSVELPVLVPGKAPSLRPTDDLAILNKLGKHLLLGSHYALSLFVFSRTAEFFGSNVDPGETLPATNPDPLVLSTTVVKILVNHLRKDKPSPV